MYVKSIPLSPPETTNMPTPCVRIIKKATKTTCMCRLKKATEKIDICALCVFFFAVGGIYFEFYQHSSLYLCRGKVS